METVSSPDIAAAAVTPAAASSGTAELLRRLLIVLAGLAVVGTAIDLAMVRHWTSPSQLVAWAALGVASVAGVLLVARPSRTVVLVVRALAIAVALSAAVGVYVHVDSNYEAGPLDYRYVDTWEAMPAVSRWWAAATKTVGPASPIAPVALAHAALCLLFATVRHPALALDRAGRQPRSAMPSSSAGVGRG